MARPNVAPPGARIALLVFVAALAAGAAMFVRVHGGQGAASQRPGAFVAAPPRAAPGAPARATP